MFKNFKNKSFVQKILFIVFFPLILIEYFLIYFYRICISPLLPRVCKFTPSCSTYFLLALGEYGIFKGSYLGVIRILKCNPWSKGGIDPLKPNIRGKIKWIL